MVVTHGYISYHQLVIIICFLRIPARIFGCVYVLIALIAMPVDITCFFAYKIGRVMVKSKEIKSTFKTNMYDNELSHFSFLSGIIQVINL